jgi:photosystem II stability/assembly factor-like uncharacterized protein
MRGWKQLGAALIGFAAAIGVHGGNGVWTSNGPEGGLTYDVAAHPGNSAILYALARSGVFRSDDGGLSWTQLAGTPQLFVSPISSLAIDAEQPDSVYVQTPGKGVYRSLDGGSNWVKTAWSPTASWQLGRLYDAPGQTGVLYTHIRSFSAGSPPPAFFLRSTDGGESFTHIGTGLPANVTVNVMAVAGSTLLLGTNFYSIGSGNPNPPSIFRSIDGGLNWNGVFVEPTTAMNAGFAAQVTGLAIADTTYAYAQVNARVRRSDDGGSNWLAVQTTPATMNTPSGNNMQSLFAHASAPLTVWAHGVTGLRRSTDGGVSFSDVTAGLAPNATYLPVVPPLIPAQPSVTRLSATADFVSGVSGALWLSAEGGGLYRSLDAGTNWSASNAGLESVNIRALAVHPGQHASNHPGPGSPAQRIYAGLADLSTGSPGLYASANASATWTVLNSGLRAAQIRDIVIDPATTGGVEPNGQPSDPPAVTPPSTASTRMYAVGSALVSPGQYRNGGLYRSLNGGVTWSVIDNGLPLRTLTNVGDPPTTIQVADVSVVRDLALDPRSCSPAVFPCVTPLQRLWASATGFGVSTMITAPGIDPHCTGTATRFDVSHRVIVSSDGGDSWAGSENGLPPSDRQFCSVAGVPHNVGSTVTPLNIAVSPSDSNVLYLGTFVALQDSPAGHMLPDAPSGVFKSVDGGANWLLANNGLPARSGFSAMKRDVMAMAIHPGNDQILWASVIEFLVPGTSAIYKTTDGGANWFLSSNGIPTSFDVRALIVDPGDPNTLYAAGAGTEADPGAVYKSEDGGTTWRSISVGLPADSATSLALDAFNPNLLHAGTLTGVWSLTQVPDGDGDGVPDATENNAPNGGDGNGDSSPDAAQREVGSTVVIFRRPEGVGGFFTSDIDVAASTPTAVGGCTQAVDVQAQLAAPFGRDYTADGVRFYKYPRDLVRFEILDCAQAKVDLTFHNAQFASEYGWSFRYFGPATPGDEDSFDWADIGARVQRAGTSQTMWRATLDANQFGSYRPVGDRILFVGGPACYDDRIFRNSLETPPDSGPPTCDH